MVIAHNRIVPAIPLFSNILHAVATKFQHIIDRLFDRIIVQKFPIMQGTVGNTTDMSHNHAMESLDRDSCETNGKETILDRRNNSGLPEYESLLRREDSSGMQDLPQTVKLPCAVPMRFCIACSSKFWYDKRLPM